MNKRIHSTDNHQGVLYFLISFCLLNLLSAMLLISSLGFWAGLVLSSWHFPISILIGIILNYFAAACILKEKRNPIFIKSSLIVLLIIGISIVLAMYIYDTSWDGQGYHLKTVYALKNGWNPFYGEVPPYPEFPQHALWVNYYPKALELCEACIYKTTGLVETAKATNIILITAACGLCYSLFRRANVFSKRNAFALSFFLAFNPISINQLFTLYDDGQLASVILCLLAAFIYLFIWEGLISLLLLGSVILIFANIKFTSLLFIIIFMVALFGILIWQRHYLLLKRVLLTSVIAGSISLLLIGYNPYMVNILKGRNIFYPVVGSDKVEIIGTNLPFGFEGKGRIKKFLLSFFSYTSKDGSWVGAKEEPHLKFPFMISKSELISAKEEDARVGGFGPLFSGITLLSLGLLIYVTLRKREKPGDLLAAWYWIIVILISVLLIPEAWWARFVPQLWLIPLIPLIFLQWQSANKYRLMIQLIYLMIGLNILFALLSIPSRYTRSLSVQQQTAQLAASTQPIKIAVAELNSVKVRFEENDIQFVEVSKTDIKDKVQIVWTDAYFEKPEHFPAPVFEPFSFKILRSFKKLIGR